MRFEPEPEALERMTGRFSASQERSLIEQFRALAFKRGSTAAESTIGEYLLMLK